MDWRRIVWDVGSQRDPQRLSVGSILGAERQRERERERETNHHPTSPITNASVIEEATRKPSERRALQDNPFPLCNLPLLIITIKVSWVLVMRYTKLLSYYSKRK
jgi:hypothetical protein